MPATTEKETNKSSAPASTPSSFFGGSFFSSVTLSVNALSQTIQTKGMPELNKRFNQLQQRARAIPNQIATLQGDLESERALFVQSNKSDAKNGMSLPSRGSESVAPWEGYQGYEAEMKQAILDISTDERNFLIPPPEDTNFEFDLNAYSQSAQAALKKDINLSQSRFSLVPQQVTEPTFWKNYFYRVTLAKQAVLSHPAKSTNQDVLFDFKDEHEEKEIADTTVGDNNKVVTADPSPIITATKNQDNYEGMEDWEIELRKAAI